MITYRKKSLKVEIIEEKHYYCSSTINGRIAGRIKDFIEKGKYSRIADIIIIPGAKNSESNVACIIYETAAESGGGQ